MVVSTVMHSADVWVVMAKQEPLVAMEFALHKDLPLQVEPMGMVAFPLVMGLVALDIILLGQVAAQCQHIQPMVALPMVVSVVAVAITLAVVEILALVAVILVALLEALMAVLVVAVDPII